MKKITIKFLLPIFCVLLATQVKAQSDTTEQRAGSLDFTDLPQFTYGNGLGITSPDSLYQLNIRFRMQNRISFDVNDYAVTEVEARVRRVRLRFDGYVFSPKVGYALQLAFAGEDIGDFTGNVPNILRDAVIYLRPTNNFVIFFGQTKLPGNRQRVNSSGDLQLIDRSLNNAIFNIDRDFGLQFHYTNYLVGSSIYALKGAITTGEGRNWLTSPGAFLAYTGRAEFFPFGAFTNRGDFFEGDLAREPKPKLSVGAVYSFNDGALRTAGQRGVEMTDAKDITSIFFDFLFKYRGFALSAEYASKYTQDPLSFNAAKPEQAVFVFNGQGYFLQSSYLFLNNYEIVGRYDRVHADKSISAFVPLNSSLYTLGVNKYLRGHRLKFQVDATYIVNQPFDTPTVFNDSWQFRFQIELGI